MTLHIKQQIYRSLNALFHDSAASSIRLSTVFNLVGGETNLVVVPKWSVSNTDETLTMSSACQVEYLVRCMTHRDHSVDEQKQQVDNDEIENNKTREMKDNVNNDHVSNDETSNNNNNDDEIVCDYPEAPYLMTVAHRLTQWMHHKQFPIQFQQFKHIDEDFEYYQHLRSMPMHQWISDFGLDHLLEGNSTSAAIDDSAMDQFVSHVLSRVGIRGLLTLLHLRKTAGSIDYFPPTKSQLYDSFNQIHGGKSDLTVGARALAKHCHRSVTDNWWGAVKGSSRMKNAHAQEVLDRILSTCTFLNCHLLPHDIPCFEARNKDGYGARWVFARMNPKPDANLDTSENSNQIVFRGFLEPHDPTGHEKGWKH